MQCLSDEAVLEFVEGRSRSDLVAGIDEHIASCATCRELVAETAKFYFERTRQPDATEVSHTRGTHPDVMTAPPSPGDFVGRYQLLHSLGAGGMGVVYAAHDPQLGRTVALKLIRADLDADPAHLRERLQREARAMAKVSHPNVVHVYDAGVHEGHVYVTMECVRGMTLREWLEVERRPWQDVARVLMQAGDGLLAAHAAGLVHRDFKPANVLCGEDGRVRVTDFGLARPAALAEGNTVARESHPEGVSAATLGTLTRTGRFAGTPGYMALEQLLGKGADARSDQFGFCVSFYEALYGVRPFGGADVTALTEAVTLGSVSAPADPGSVPSDLRAILMRGLSARSEDRFPSMQELLAQLQLICSDVERSGAASVRAAPPVNTVPAAKSAVAFGEAAPPDAKRTGRSRATTIAVVGLGALTAIASAVVVSGFVSTSREPAPSTQPIAASEPSLPGPIAAPAIAEETTGMVAEALPRTSATATNKRPSASPRAPRKSPQGAGSGAAATRAPAAPRAPRLRDESALKPFDEPVP